MRWTVGSSEIVIAILLWSLIGATSGLASSEHGVGFSAPVNPEQRATTAAPWFVRDAQRTLRDLGYQPGPIDGVMGPRTQTALRSYQRTEGLPVTGRLDPETMARLDIHDRLFGSPHSRRSGQLAQTGSRGRGP